MEGINEGNNKNKNALGWLKKIGLAGFLFFLVKGLVWIAVFMGVGSLVEC